MLFGHDLLGRPETNYVPWLVAALAPVLMVHLIDYQRSVAAAVASLVLLSAGAGYTLYALDAWTWLPAVAPFLLWSLNGVRALHADKAMG
jgi:hypothetical protein